MNDKTIVFIIIILLMVLIFFRFCEGTRENTNPETNSVLKKRAETQVHDSTITTNSPSLSVNNTNNYTQPDLIVNDLGNILESVDISKPQLPFQQDNAEDNPNNDNEETEQHRAPSGSFTIGNREDVYHAPSGSFTIGNSGENNTQFKAEITEEVKSMDEYIKQQLEKRSPYQSFHVNNPISLSGKTKQEIYDIRKQYVSDSLFNYPGYTPSEQVFGQIQDGKQWISTDRCYSGDALKTDGSSDEASDINNPSALITIAWPHFITENETKGRDYCGNALLPISINYKKNENLIDVTYNRLPYLKKDFNNYPYELRGINARDFGYNYVFLDEGKSKNVVEFKNIDNLSKRCIELSDNIHTDNYCKVSGGCNNDIQNHPSLNFYYDKPDEETILYIKLWRNKPENPNEPSDINERITILSN